MTIRHLHIQKTGGSSLLTCLVLMYPRDIFIFTNAPKQDRRRYEELSDLDRNKLEIIAGHAPLTTGIQEVDSVPTLTLLRHPIHRVKSFCQHVSEGKGGYLRNFFSPETFNLDDFLDRSNEWPELHWQLSNLQTRVLLGYENYALPDRDSEAFLKDAFDVLQRKDFCFGITEKFDLSLILFRHIFKWHKWPICKIRNVKNQERLLEFSDAQLERIRQLNLIDMELYSLAYKIFNARIAKLPFDAHRAANRLKAIRRVYPYRFAALRSYMRNPKGRKIHGVRTRVKKVPF